jgi:predicted nucleic acid-binding protein
MADLAHSEETFATTLFTLAELWVGVQRSKDPAAEESAVADMLRGLEILPFDEAAARMFGRVTAYLLVRGRSAGDMDALIGSVALVNGHTLVTGNPRHFEDMPGLAVYRY